MSSISNRFYITALEDGTTLHGNLAVEGSLSQAWNGQAAVPDWTIAANQPLIYLTLLSGGTLVAPSNDFKWLYNGAEITDSDTRFQKTTKVVTYGTGASQQSVTMPALKIVANLASSSNVDVDLITFEGNYIINGTGISFTATAQIRISVITSGSSLGVINFHNGISDITTKGQVVVAYGMLYNPDGTADSTVTTKWYLNDSSTPTTGTTIEGHTNAYQVTEASVVDHATLRCEFYKGDNLLYTAYASVDDMQDPEFMYIQYNGNNGNAASLRKNEVAELKIWVGTRTDSNILGGKDNPTYPIIKIRILDGDGIPLGGDDDTSTPKRNGSYAGTTKGGQPYGYIPAVDNVGGVYDAQGWRTIPLIESGDDKGKAVVCPHYDTVNQVCKKNLTGIILAQTAS